MTAIHVVIWPIFTLIQRPDKMHAGLPMNYEPVPHLLSGSKEEHISNNNRLKYSLTWATRCDATQYQATICRCLFIYTWYRMVKRMRVALMVARVSFVWHWPWGKSLDKYSNSGTIRTRRILAQVIIGNFAASRSVPWAWHSLHSPRSHWCMADVR